MKSFVKWVMEVLSNKSIAIMACHDHHNRLSKQIKFVFAVQMSAFYDDPTCKLILENEI